MTTNLPAHRQSQALTTQAALSPAIKRGIGDLLIAFPAGSPAVQSEDRLRLLQIYAEACREFDEGVAEEALKHLKFHNPRNPFAPTPQDVREACQKVVKAAMEVEYYAMVERETKEFLAKQEQDEANAARR